MLKKSPHASEVGSIRQNDDDLDVEEYESEFGRGISDLLNWRIIATVAMVIVAVAFVVFMSSIPEAGFVFEGRVTRIDIEHVVVSVRNNQTIQHLNATYGMCFGDRAGFICKINDMVEITQFTSWFDEVWIVTALVD